MLSLLLLFFGMHQRSRPEPFYRFWFAGWITVYLSYAVWEIPVQTRALELTQDVVRYHLILVGLTLFALSPRVTAARMKQTLKAVAAVYVAASVVLTLALFGGRGTRWWMAAALLVMEAVGVWVIATMVPRRWKMGRLSLFGMAGIACLVLLARTIRFEYEGIPETIQAQLVFVAALTYVSSPARKNLSGMIGSFGFAFWGLFYLLSEALYPMSQTQRVLYTLWSIPKYLVGFSMILQIFEASRREANQLATQYRRLYEDFRRMFQSHPYPMWIYDPEKGRLLTANKSAVRTYGYSRAELAEMAVGELEAPAGRDGGGAEFGLEQRRSVAERRYRKKDGGLLWVDVSDHAVFFQGRGARLHMARDVTERRRETEELFYRANHDVLTGLPNRALLRDRVEQCLLRCERDRREAAMFTIDVDHFKRVNDTHGHPVGDECLKAVAARLQGRIRQVDTLARTGGEEFTAIVGGLHGRADAETIGRLLLDLFTDPIRLPDCDLAVTVSIGVALYPGDAIDAETLQKMSDAALYEAKHGGRNCMRMYGQRVAAD